MALRRIFTKTEFIAGGRTEMELRWGERRGKWIRVVRGVYAEGSAPPDALTTAVATLRARNDVAYGLVAGALYGFDAVELPDSTLPRRRTTPFDKRIEIIDGVECASGLQTMLDLAVLLDDLQWEQALESALFKRRLVLDELVDALPALAARHLAGVGRIRRVLALRPPGAPPTESLLETLAVQMSRETDGVPEPTRQFEVVDDGGFRIRIDLSWPDVGAFNELDGQQHKGQPVYDANRESRVVAATGWLCGRFSWAEVRYNPKASGRRLARIIEQARRRPRSA